MAWIKDEKDYNAGEYHEHLLEQWNKCVEMANSCSDKRMNSNMMFLTINSALIGVFSFGTGCKSCVLSIVGILVSIVWIISIKNYRQLNKVKFELIIEMEKELPAAPYTEEKKKLIDNKKYALLTQIEVWLPIALIVLYVVLFVIDYLA